ncbi:hypothetical protein DL96DRAFT_1617104 [Flagelloscypha sp. PMI_526]|nr:hypothetical protein DL96DRAFT_1617104 [Flagelloscypha sp. PMI_526]
MSKNQPVKDGDKTNQGVLLEHEASLRNLPHDLLLYIFSLSEAQTVAQLRQCCKQFRELSNEHIVWLDVLKRSCANLNLPVPSFPQNSCSSQDIELLATAWIRFQLVLRNVQDGVPPPHKIARLIDTGGHVHALHQTPDGQFLFVLHSTGLRVWTLHTSSPKLVGFYELDIPSDARALLTIERENDTNFMACLNFSSSVHMLDQWLAFRFTFSEHEHLQTTLDLLSKLDKLSFTASWWGPWCMPPAFTVLVMSFQHPWKGKYYLLWDFAKDACATWAADVNDQNLTSSVIVLRGFIIGFNKASQDITVYILPELPSKDTYAPKASATLSNPAILRISPEAGLSNRRIVFPVNESMSFSGKYSAFDYDGRASICDAGDGSWVLERSEFFRTELPSSKFGSLPLEFKQSHSLHIPSPQSFPIIEHMIADACICPDQSLLIHAASISGTQIVFHLSGPTGDSSGNELGRGILYDSEDRHILNDRLYSLSPFAGRLCVATEDGVEVIDFVESLYLQNIPSV